MMDNLLFKSGNSGQVNIDEAQGIVECFVAGIGNKDSVGDVVISGAFAKSLTRRKPRVVWGHSWNDPIGKVLEMYEVSVGDSRLPAKMRNAGIGGLYAKVQFNLNSEKGKEAFATVAFFGEEQEWSIGYKTIDSVFDPNLQANILKEVELYEVSPVLHGANQLTGTISIKGDEKGHMPIIPMAGMGMQMMPEMPRIVVIASPQEEENEASEGNPFDEGMAQELQQPDKMALQAELTERTGSKIEVMNATENSVVFRRTTADGKASMYRLPYHKEGNQYMFGKPEPYAAANPSPQAIQNVEQKPNTPVVVPNGGIAYRTDDQAEMATLFAGENVVQSPWGKSDVSHLIELPESYMASAKDFISPVLRHHKLIARPNAKGIVIDGLLTANALDALQNAVKALGATLGQTSGNIGQAIGKIRDLAQTFNPYALDGDGDGFVQDGSAFQRPYIPVKKPGFDLPDVRGRKRSGDALLDKPRSAPKLPKDKNTWTRAQRNDALLAGVIDPETREDVAFLANRRPDNEGIAKYWDMSEADITKEGNKLINARRQATGTEKERIDEELLKVSHEFQRRASYAETFGQEFVPPAKRETPEAMVPEAEKPKPAKPGRTEAEGLASAGKVFDALNTDDLTDGKGYREWDELSDNEKFEMFEEVQYDYLYDRFSDRGDDGLVDLMDSGDYDDDILEHAEEVYNKIKAKREEEGDRAADAAMDRAREEDGFASRGDDEPDAEELAQREADRALDEQADAALDRAIEGYIEKYGEDEFDKLSSDEQDALLEQGRDQARGLASSGSKLHTNTDVLMEIARRDGWKGGDKQPPAKSYRKAQEALDNWSRLTPEERNNLLDNEEPTIKEFVDALLKARDNRLAGIRSVQTERRNAERKRRAAEEKLKRQFAGGDTSGVDTSALSDYFPEDEYGNLGRAGREYVNAVLTNWAEMSQADRDKAMRDHGTIIDDPDSVVETLRDALDDYGYKNPKIARFLDDAAAESDIFEMTGFESRGEGTFGSNPEDSKAAQIFDAILDKYWKMWGFEVPDEDDKGWDEPFGFASRGNEEEVKQSKLDELVGGVRERLIAELETADPATWKPSWRNDSLPVNPITGKPYRGFNAFWLMMRTKGEDYKTGRFAGFNQLKARGAQVRKGEKGVPILRPQLVKKEDEDGNVKEFVVFRGATVFNIDQTDGGDEALRAIPADLPESQRIAILDETLKELGVNVRTENTTPHYNPDGDYISMPDFAKGTSALEWTSTLAHEAVHWTGHKSRLDRLSLKDYSSDKKVRAYEELIAEIGSAMLLAAHGIDAPFRQDHAPYIKGWISLLKDDPDALGNAFKDAQAAVNHMLEKSPNLRKLFGGLDSGKKAPDVDAPTEVNVPVGASEGFASLHRVRTPGSEVLTGILYDDNSGELMVGFMKGKSWNDLSDEDRQNWIGKYIESQRDVGGYRAPLSDSQIDDIARDLYDDSREIGWYVYSDVSMEEVNELAAVKSKGRHINALKKLKKARKASDDDKFNFFGRDERVQDVAKKQVDGFTSRGPAEPNEGLRRHKLMPADIREKMPELYSTEDVDLNDKIVAVKFFSPYSNWTWYGVEFDGKDTFFGYVEGFEGEWGNFSLNELAGAQLRNGVPAVERDMSFRPTKFGELMTSDGFASSGSKKIGIEPRYGDSVWIDKTQQRILKQNTDWNSLSHDDQIDWANSFLDEYLRENEMGHGLSDVANGRRLNGRPDIELLNYAEQAYARMSDAHISRRAQFGEEEGLASVGKRTRRLGIKPSNAVDYVSYDPEGENLFVAYKREDGRGDMYVYEGVSMDDAIGIENAQSVGKAINDIKRRKNVRKATPDEIIGLSDSDRKEGNSLKRAKAVNTANAVFANDEHRKNRNIQLEINADRISVEDDGTIVWESADDTMRYTISPTDDGGYLVSAEKLSRGGREEPDTFETVFSSKENSQDDAITALFDAAKAKIADDDAEAKVDRELDAMRRELDMAGDAPGVESVDVTYSSALDAVDYNPSTQELRVSYKDGGTYVYEGVDRTTFEEFKSAPSKGRAMNDIKRAHPYRKDSEWTGGGDEDGGIEEFDVRGSEAVEKVTYDPSKEELTVVYSGGKGYIYSGVTREEADAVRSAPSKGRAINDVKRTHDVRKVSAKKSDDSGVTEADIAGTTTGEFASDELRAFIDEQEGLLEAMRGNGESADKLAQQQRVIDKAKRDLGAIEGGSPRVIDPAPAPKPRMATKKPPRGGKRVRNRNVVIEMEQGTLDEIIEAEGKNITVDALRDAAGSPMGKYTKGPRKGKNRGYDTITVRDAETGELLHANEILLTSSASPGNPSAANRKRGYIRARSYAGRQGHNVMKDEGPSLRGEGRGMTDYDKRVYGLGSDEKNREAGLASRGSDLKRNLQARLDDMISRQEALDTSTPEGRREWENLEESIGILDDRILGMGEGQVARDDDGFASAGRYRQYESGWDAVAETAQVTSRPESSTPRWTDLDYDQQNEFIHEVDYDYMYDNHGELGDDGIVDAMESGRYDDAINEHAAMVWDTIADRKENQRLVRALEGTDANPEERASIAKHWSDNDGIHDEYMEKANGDLGEAMNLAYEDYISSLADMQDDGFASRYYGDFSREEEEVLRAADKAKLAEIDAPVVRGEKSPLLKPRRHRYEWDGFGQGGAAHQQSYERTYDINGAITMPKWNRDGVQRTKFADQIVKDWSRSDLTVDEIAERFNLTPLQVQDVLEDAAARIRYGESISPEDAARRLSEWSTFNGIYAGADTHREIGQRASELFVGDRKYTDIPEPTDAIKKARAPREELRRDWRIWTQASKDRSIAQNELVNSQKYRDEQDKYRKSIKAIENASERIADDRRLNRSQEGDPAFNSPEENLRIFTEQMTGREIDEVLSGTSFEHNSIEASFDYDDYRDEYFSDGEQVDIDDLEVDWFVDIDALTDKEREELVSAIAEHRRAVEARANDAREKLGLSIDASREDAKKAVEDAKKAVRDVPGEMKREVERNNPVPKQPMLARQISGLRGVTDEEGKYVDLDTLADGFASRGDGFASSGDRGENGYFTEYPRGEEGSYKDYVAKVYEEADAALEWDKNDYRESVRALVEEGRIMGGPGDSYDDVMRAHRQSYLDNFGLTEAEWESASANMAERRDGFASRGGPDDEELFYDDERRQRRGSRRFASDSEYGEDNEEAANMRRRDDGFASRGINMGPPVDGEWVNFEDLPADEQDQIIRDHIDNIDRTAQPDIDLEEERDFAIEQFNDNAQGARSEAAESLLEEIYDLWDKDADADNPFQRNGNLAYAEELIKNTDYVDFIDLAEARDIVKRVRERFEGRERESGDGFASRSSGLSPERERVADAQNEVDRLTRLFGSIYGETFEEDGQMELNDLIDQEMRKQRIGRREARTFARELQKDYLAYANALNDLDDAIIAEEESDMDGERQFADGLASRGRRDMTEQERDMYDDAMDSAAQEQILREEYARDMANMAKEELENNFSRLSQDDQNMYFQRALANNPDSGMTTEQILEEAKKLAMDDRRMAELEREAIGMGQSSKPRKIDVSSSSALNSVEYDEMNRVLSVEYRGRDGKGTGTVYNYDGVEPDVVDRIEAADSRGSTMREIRDNYEFRTTRKLPDSAYEGLASRGGSKYVSSDGRIVNPAKMNSDDSISLRAITDPDERKKKIDELLKFYGDSIVVKPSLGGNSKNIRISKNVNGYWVMSAMVDDGRGPRLRQLTVVGGSKRDALNSFMDGMRDRNEKFHDGGLASRGADGFASRGSGVGANDADFSQASPQIRERADRVIELRDRVAMDGVRARLNGNASPAVVRDLANGYVDADGTLYFPSHASEGDYISVRYSPKDRQYYIERIKSTPSFNRDEPDDETVVQSATEPSMMNAGFRVFEFARDKANEDFEFEQQRIERRANGLASRGGRRPTAEYEAMLDELPDMPDIDGSGRRQGTPSSRYTNSEDGPRNTINDRYDLIHTRRRIAKEMAEANGVEWNKRLNRFDGNDIVADGDEDDIAVLEELDRRIEQFNFLVSKQDQEYIEARRKESAALRKQETARDISNEVGGAPGEFDDDMEMIERYKDDDDYTVTTEDARSALRDTVDESIDSLRNQFDDYDSIADLNRLDEAKELLKSDNPDDLKRAAEITQEVADAYVRHFDEQYYEAEANADALFERGYRPVSVDTDEDYEPGDWLYDEDLDDDRGEPAVIADELFGPTLDQLRPASTSNDGFASGGRRRPGRRNQGRQRQSMAPKTRYTDEERQAIADRNILKSRRRPSKRRGGPDASEWDGFASVGTLDDSDVMTDPRGVFEGGEHGPGKDISLRKMWESIRRSGENNEWFDESMTAEKLARDLRIPRNIAQGLLDARPQSGRPELFIDDPYLADDLSQRIGISRTRLFGFDPLAYYDDRGNIAQTEEQIDAAIASERARRAARIAAREGRRTGKANLYRNEAGNVDVRVLEGILNVKLTDDNGNLLNPSALERVTRDTGLGWAGEKWRRIYSRGGALSPLDVEELVKRGMLDQAMLPQRDDKTFGEVFQWPGFAGRPSNEIVDALSEVLGVDRQEVMAQRRSIQEALTLANKNERKAVATRNIRQAKLKLSRSKIKELIERLGLDPDEFDAWFRGE